MKVKVTGFSDHDENFSQVAMYSGLSCSKPRELKIQTVFDPRVPFRDSCHRRRVDHCSTSGGVGSTRTLADKAVFRLGKPESKRLGGPSFFYFVLLEMSHYGTVGATILRWCREGWSGVSSYAARFCSSFSIPRPLLASHGNMNRAAAAAVAEPKITNNPKRCVGGKLDKSSGQTFSPM